ncbi:MAG: hypothetical protein ACXWE1_07505 [Thermoanaerobaculia bacterium]
MSMRRVALVLCLVLFPDSACHRARRDPVMACLTGAVAAAEARDADGVMRHVAEGFRDAEGGGRVDAAALVSRTLTAYESLSLTLSGVAIERGPAAAQAKFRVRMSGKPRTVGGLDGLLPRSSHWSFDVRLEAGTGEWKIAWASWTRLEDRD